MGSIPRRGLLLLWRCGGVFVMVVLCWCFFGGGVVVFVVWCGGIFVVV